VEAEREVIGHGDVLDLRQRAGALEHLLVEGFAARFFVALQDDIEGKRDAVLGIEPGAHLLRGLQSAHDQAGADEQD
jgi:hypothetical protein